MNKPFFSALNGTIDKSNGIIRGVSVVTIGEAQGHDLKIDATTLSQVKAVADRAGSLQVKIDHWSGFEGIVGTLQNFVIDGAQLRADLHLLANHPARDRVIEMAEKMPTNFGLSIVFSGDPETINGAAFARCSELFSVDLVDRPAANPTGLFASATPELIELRRKHIAEIDTHRARIHELELKLLDQEAASTDMRRQLDVMQKRYATQQHDIEILASRRAAEIVASTGTSMPANISPAGDQRSHLTGLELAKAMNKQRQTSR